MNKRQFIIAAILFLLVFTFPFYKVCSFLSEFSNGFAGDSKGDFSIIKTVDSSDGKHSAIYWSGMGGGAAGWCREYVNVTGKNERFNIDNTKENRTNSVFDARCSNKVEMKWKSNDELKIFYSVESEGTNLSMKPVSNDEQVKINYEVKSTD